MCSLSALELRSHPWLNGEGAVLGGIFSERQKREKMVGETGFEPATSASQTQRSTKLSYSPNEVALTIELGLCFAAPQSAFPMWTVLSGS